MTERDTTGRHRPFTGMMVLAMALGGAVCAAAEKPTSQGTNPARPNILVIMADEHNAGVLGCYGNRIVQTPHLDKLAAHGVVFDAAYTNSPLCVPCRLSFTAGKYISRIGAWNNDCSLPSDDYPSIGRVMAAVGYEPVLCGKMHYARDRRYGFREIGGNMNNNEMTGKGSRRPADDLNAKNRSGAGRFKDFHPGDHSGILDHDRRVTAATVAFLSKRQPSDKPFFFIAGYLAPHFPLIVPEKYWQNYRGKVPMPTVPAGYLESLPLNYKHLRAGFGVVDVDAATVQKGRELYYGLTQWLDEEVGKVLETLERSPLSANTVVIYTADHGENMGEHGMWWKSCMFDQAARVPLMITWPQRWAGRQRRAGACSLVDVVQTIAELGGAKVPADWNGNSLCAWMDHSDAPWKNMAVSEYYAHHIASGYAMLRQGSYKYVYHAPPDATHPPQRELYDLKTDPGEFHNLATQSEQKEHIEQMHAALIKELGEDPEKTELRCRSEIAKGYKSAR